MWRTPKQINMSFTTTRVTRSSTSTPKRPATTNKKNVPAKQRKVVKRKPAEITPTDLKDRLNQLHEQNYSMKRENIELKVNNDKLAFDLKKCNDQKEQYSQIANDLEKCKETSLKLAAENLSLKEKLQNSDKTLKQIAYIELKEKNDKLVGNLEKYIELKEKYDKLIVDLEKYKATSLKLGSENKALTEKLQNSVEFL